MTIKNDRATTTHEQFTPKPTHVCRVCGAPARVIDYRPGPAVELKLRCAAGHYTETGAEPDLRHRALDALDLLDLVRFRAAPEEPLDVADDPHTAAAWAITSRGPASPSMLQRAGIGKARVADLVRAGVIVPEVKP